MGQGGFGGQYETGVSSKRSPDERSDIQGWTPHIAEPVITVRAQLRSSRGARSRGPLAYAGYLLGLIMLLTYPPFGMVFEPLAKMTRMPLVHA
jgi:hypothetical protein